jgi:hypothetical protein
MVRHAKQSPRFLAYRMPRKEKDTIHSITKQQGNTMTSIQEITPPDEKNSFDLIAYNWRLAYLAVLAGASQRPHSPTHLHFLVYGVPVGSV